MPDEIVGKTVAFNSSYEEKCFAVWFELGRPGYAKVVESLPDDEHGRKPSRNVFLMWRKEKDWDVRADEIEARASLVTDDVLLNHRILMVKRQASKAKELQELGMEFLREEGFDSAASAVSAVIKGAELERQSRGMDDMLKRFSEMDDAQLTRAISDLLERKEISSGEIIDAADIPEEKTEEDVEE